ncbi:hypothetical protein ACFL7E_00015 [Thermodesulfobacteriota bacterium]
MAGFYHMKKVVQEREKGFLQNSIRGFVGYINCQSVLLNLYLNFAQAEVSICKAFQGAAIVCYCMP